jgi:hypothetical protein
MRASPYTMFALVSATLALACTSEVPSQAKQRPAAEARRSGGDATPPTQGKAVPLSAPMIPTLEGSVISTVSGLSLRAEPSTSANRLAALAENEALMIASVSVDETIGDKANRWYEVITSDGTRGFAFGAYLRPSPGGEVVRKATERAKQERGRIKPLDSTTLQRLLAKRGFRPTPTFKALVIAIEGSPEEGFSFHPYDYMGTSTHRDNWWPASTVKIFSAVAALQRAHAWGFGPRTNVTFHYEEEDVTARLSTLVKRALTPSNNLAFDRLTEIAGSKYLHETLFTRKYGLQHTTLLRSYAHRLRNPETEEGDSRDSPKMTLKSGKKTKTIQGRLYERSTRSRKCFGLDKSNQPRSGPPFDGNCTTLRDLAEIMIRVMLHEDLPASERFSLGPKALKVLRDAMSKRRSRGMNVVDGLKAGFGARTTKTWSKPGYALSWFSDNVFIHVPGTDERYVVVMADYPGREACDEGARHIGAILGRGLLRPNRGGSGK